VSARLLFAGIGVLALLAGTALWFGSRERSPVPIAGPAEAGPAVVFSTPFAGLDGQRRSLGAFQGKLLVVNFWATWCAPCREEMPAFVRLQERWAARGVQFIGIANDEPEKVRRFGEELRITYPLWTGSQDVADFSRRLGNRLGVLPHTVILDARGIVVESRIGVFAEDDLDARLRVLTESRS
jgi:thiol-disulfide isomerase/thioredoxin